MNVNMTSGYIGSTEVWRQLVTNIVDKITQYPEDSLYFEQEMFTKLQRQWALISAKEKYELPKVNIDLPPSYIHLWESGALFLFDKLFYAFRYGMEKVDFETVETEILNVFYAPNDFAKLRFYKSRDGLDAKKLIIEPLSEYFEERTFNEKNYFNYASLDSFRSLPAPSLQVLADSLVVIDGEFHVNGAIACLYPNVCFLDGEWEAIVEQPDIGVMRYKSFAELFVTNCLGCLTEDFNENSSLSTYFDKDDLFKLLFDNSKTYTFDDY